MAGSILDLISSAMGRPDPMSQLAAAYGGQQPGGPAGGPSPGAGPAGPPPTAGPAAAPGGAPGAPGAPGPPQQPPQQPQAYQSPPDLVQLNSRLAQGPTPAPQQPQPQQQPDLMSMYMGMAQRQQASEQFNRGAGLLAASMYPGRRPDLIMNAMTNATGDPNAIMRTVMGISDFQRQQQQYQQIQAAAPGLAKQLYGENPTPEQMQMARGLIASGQFGPIETNLVGGADLDQRQYQAAVRNGTFQGTYTDWRNQGAATGKQLTDYTTEKGNAISTFPDLDKQYGKAEQDAEYLAANAGTAANPGPTVKAVKDWPSLTKGYSGQVAVKLGLVDQATADARAKLDELMNEQFTAGLRDTKNVRSLTEANKIGASMTAIDNPQASPAFIQGEANRIMTTAQAARGNLMAAAGKPLPSKYAGLVDDTYLNPKSPLYNGATMAPAATIQTPAQAAQSAGGAAPAAPAQAGGGAAQLTPLTDAQKAQARGLIARDGRGPVLQHLQTGGYDTSGL
jgi:hypothetical protein